MLHKPLAGQGSQPYKKTNRDPRWEHLSKAYITGRWTKPCDAYRRLVLRRRRTPSRQFFFCRDQNSKERPKSTVRANVMSDCQRPSAFRATSRALGHFASLCNCSKQQHVQPVIFQGPSHSVYVNNREVQSQLGSISCYCLTPDISVVRWTVAQWSLWTTNISQLLIFLFLVSSWFSSCFAAIRVSRVSFPGSLSVRIKIWESRKWIDIGWKNSSPQTRS